MYFEDVLAEYLKVLQARAWIYKEKSVTRQQLCEKWHVLKLFFILS